jgi:hypothetical protein
MAPVTLNEANFAFWINSKIFTVILLSIQLISYPE